ncbi:MAG TPA: ribosome small subunit-dependent GTPase A [Gemmatimonadales bacterium]|nr:ribosome small subunit-dependent GTPase A [Gemmatimonadales bacterium]
MKGVVLARSGGTFRVQTEIGEVKAVLRGRVKHADDQRLVAGDVVLLDTETGGPARILSMEPRHSVLARRAATGGTAVRRAQPIAANVDQVVVVTSARDPEPSPRMLDRFLVIAEANGLPAAIVVNKVELDRSAVPPLASRYASAGYQVLATSAKLGEGLVALRDLLRGRATVFTGASGVGKSSLLNALEPGLKLRIGAISEKWRSGTHTTRAAELVPVVLAAGGGGGVGYVVDTPGMREVATWGIEPDQLGACFPEFRPFLDQCRFDNCRHLQEPGCAIHAAVATGRCDPDRLRSYERIYEEVSVPAWSSGRRRGR